MNLIELLIYVVIIVAAIAVVVTFVHYTGVWEKIPHIGKIVIYALLAIVALLVLASFVGVGPLNIGVR